MPSEIVRRLLVARHPGTAHSCAACISVALLLPTVARAQFAQPLPQSSIYCKNYDVTNNSDLNVSIQFDALPNERYELSPGQSVTYQKTQYCSAPAYVVAGYSGSRSGSIGRNLALDPRKPNYQVVESGRYVFLIPAGESVPPAYR